MPVVAQNRHSSTPTCHSRTPTCHSRAGGNPPEALTACGTAVKFLMRRFQSLNVASGSGWGPVALADFKSVMPRDERGRWVRLPRTPATTFPVAIQPPGALPGATFMPQSPWLTPKAFLPILTASTSTAPSMNIAKLAML